jgi:LmbE family N-acetylglucosaminyl deacetylase
MHLKYPTACIVVAHPDDAEIGAFGTLLRLSQAGTRCHVAVVTHGRRGAAVDETSNDTLKLIASERRELEVIAALSGTDIEVSFLGMEDGFLRVDQALISAIEKTLKRLRPSLVISHSATCPTDHQDHNAVGQAVLNAASRVESIEAVWEMEPIKSDNSNWRPNLFIDITDKFLDKLTALEKHQTQVGREYLGRDWQTHRARQNALIAGCGKFSKERLYEGFFICRQSI